MATQESRKAGPAPRGASCSTLRPCLPWSTAGRARAPALPAPGQGCGDLAPDQRLERGQVGRASAVRQ
eukprot:10509942-Alexandrium_andersonii.AAC.1